MNGGNGRAKRTWIVIAVLIFGFGVAVGLAALYLMFSYDLRRGRCCVAVREIYSREGRTLAEFNERKARFLSESSQSRDVCNDQGLRELSFEVKGSQVTGVYLIGGQVERFFGTIEQ